MDSVSGMGIYEFRFLRQNRGVTSAVAVSRAREAASADHIAVDGEPDVKVKHEPLPLLGPRSVFVVTFPRATRRRPTDAEPPGRPQ
jgi:hypothetical protein